MKKSTREAARAAAESRKQSARDLKERKRERVSHREAVFTQAVEKHEKKKKTPFDRISEASDIDLSPHESEFWNVIVKKAGRLIDDEPSLYGLLFIAELDHFRPVSEWKPKGKSAESLFNSLCNHCIAKYPTPQFLWSALKSHEPGQGQKLTFGMSKIRDASFRIASGESFSKICNEKDFPVSFTKKQCHVFLKTPAKCDFVKAVRRTQIKSHEGSNSFFEAWSGLELFKTLHGKMDESFWESVIAILASDSMLDVNEVSPLVDYISMRRRENTAYSMKGRTIGSLLRGMEEWHNELHRVKVFKANNYDASGFTPLSFKEERKLNKSWVVDHWVVDEIRTSKDLADEGRALSHCVYSYSRSISDGRVSIWSLSKNNTKLITIEVSNTTKKIVQARGKYNRKIDNHEYKVMDKFASKNGLGISINQLW